MQEFTISMLVARARAGWRTPAAFAIILAMFTMATLAGARPVYRVSMTVVPAPSDPGTQSALPTSGALNAILGLGSGGNLNFLRYQRLLSSTVVAERLQEKYGMLQFVFSGSWDAKRKTWVPHRTFRDYLVGWLLTWSNLPTWTAPDVTALAKYLESQLIIVPAATSDIVTVSMDSGDVAFAKRVMLLAHEQANRVLRDQIAHRAQMQVAYLESKLNQTSVEDYRATLLNILGNQQKVLMLTQTDASYAAEILSPPVASPVPVSPRPLLGMFLAVLIGTLLGLAIVIFLGPDWWRLPLKRISALSNGRRKKVSIVRS